MTRRLPIVAAVLGLLAVLLVAGVAAREGGYTRALPATTSATTTAPTLLGNGSSPTAATGSSPPGEMQDRPASPVVGEVLLVLVLLLVLGGTAWLVTSLLRSGRDVVRGRDLAPPRSAGTAVRDALPPAAEQALIAIEQPDAREAVVRSWLLLGEAAAVVGLPARPAETAAEYAARIAAELDVPGGELDRLADLSREARCSQHEVGEAERAEARTLLHRLRDRLTRAPA
jgi:hypothetical protein